MPLPIDVPLRLKKLEHEYGMLDYIRKFASVVDEPMSTRAWKK